MPSIASLSDIVTGTIGRRPSGARLYHRNSRFGEPERRKLDRNLVARILFLAEALDRRTRAKGQHGGLLKAKGLDVLRALLRGFYSYRTGECFPSHEAIAQVAGCCVETVRRKLRVLEAAGIIQTIRRKVVVSVSRARRERYDFAVQTSNSYVFNIPTPDRREHGDLALPLFTRTKLETIPVLPDAKFRDETSQGLKTKEAAQLEAALAAYRAALEAHDIN
ncbi:MAG TPA: helix-turn-helix domain-containing protein [Burkholderiales bacterium]